MLTFLSLLILTWSYPGDDIRSIRAFHFVDDKIASSGDLSLDQYEYIKEYGFRHVINLLPGNQLKERKHVESLGMTYTQIPVDWTNPTMENLDAFVKKMNELKGSKVYVHCAANMRASAFLFVYRVTQLKVDKKTARAHMDSVWFPTKQWNDFIRNGLSKYGIDPEWRLFGKGVEIIRTQGVQSFRQMKRSVDLKFDKRELLNLADAVWQEEQDTSKTIDLYRLCVDFFPDEPDGYLNLGGILRDIPSKKQEAVDVYRQYMKKWPNDIWAKRYLGKLDVPEFKSYWDGVAYDAGQFASLIGDYDAKGHFEFTIARSGSQLNFKTPWLNEAIPLLRDPDGNWFVTRWKWRFEMAPGSGKIIIHHDEGSFTGERK